MNELKEAVRKTTGRDDMGDFTFTYEEEADPEVFFVPYVWEVIVCVATASSIEWKKDKFRYFHSWKKRRKKRRLLQQRDTRKTYRTLCRNFTCESNPC